MPVKAGDLGKAGEIQKKQKELEATIEKLQGKSAKGKNRRKQLLVDENDGGRYCIRVDKDSGAEADRRRKQTPCTPGKGTP